MSGTPLLPWGLTRQRLVSAPKGSLVDAGGVLPPDGVALGGEVGQDGAGDFAGRQGAEIERGLLVLGGYGHGAGTKEPMATRRATSSGWVGYSGLKSGAWVLRRACRVRAGCRRVAGRVRTR